jgi:hypothetical protein
MNITLPTQNLNASGLRIRNGILYLRHGESFQNVIYRLTYFMKGKNFCYYCKKKIPRNEITMDHMYPRSVGEPTIPQNLLPACKSCNGSKSDMTYEQYMTLLSLGPFEADSYLSKITALKEGYKKIGSFQIPSDWITPVKTDNIHTNIDFANLVSTKYDKVKKYYETYGSFQYPIVLDRKNFSLDGFYVLFVAKSLDVEYIPAIVLDNVEMR